MNSRADVLHDSPWQGVLHVTGGGSGLLAELLTTPGASGTVLEASVPYSTAALRDLLGRTPDQACAAATARAMAMAAFERARQLAAGESVDRLFGLGCTASLASRREKRGAHRAYATVQTAAATRTFAFTFSGDRPTEERELVEGLWLLLAQSLDLPLTALPTAPLDETLTIGTAGWRDLLLGLTSAICTAPHDGRLLLPGSFNPLHDGHRRMLALAEAETGLRGAYELSVANVDKPTLDYTEIAHRITQFDRPAWLTRLPTFLEKARAFPGAVFAVGVDTLERIAAPRYYGDTTARDSALAELMALGCRFCVFGRQTDSGFLTLEDLPLPHPLRSLCTGFDRSEFEDPSSSTALRRGSS